MKQICATVLLIVLAGITGCDDAYTGTYTPAAEGASCTQGGDCETGLSCISDLCVKETENNDDDSEQADEGFDFPPGHGNGYFDGESGSCTQLMCQVSEKTASGCFCDKFCFQAGDCCDNVCDVCGDHPGCVEADDTDVIVDSDSDVVVDADSDVIEDTDSGVVEDSDSGVVEDSDSDDCHNNDNQ